MGLGVVAFVLCMLSENYDYDTIAFFIVSCIIYALRFKKLCIIGRISGIYGSPKFNANLILSEIKDDEQLSKRASLQYETVKDDKLISREIKRLSLRLPLRILGYAGIAAVVFGVVLATKGFSDNSKIEDAVDVADFAMLSDGRSVTGSVSEIYCSSAIGLDSFSPDAYWCRIGDSAVTIKATGESREKFALLYNHFAQQNETPKYEGKPEVTGSSPDAVVFYGIIREGDDKIINTKVLERHKVSNAVEDLHIEIINPETADRLVTIGVLLIVFGALAYLCANIPVHQKKE